MDGNLIPKIVTVFASKGGVGKTTLAYELAWILQAVLVDLDWDAGGATGQWGYRRQDYRASPLLDALDTGGVPTPVRAKRRPDLVPSHPDLAMNHPESDELADCLSKWVVEWGREFTVVDTHPGGGSVAFGALAAASVVVIPAVLKMRELDALEDSLRELNEYPILVVPNMVPSVPPGRMLERLDHIVKGANVPVAPPVSFYTWWPRRQLRAAITSTEPPTMNLVPVIAEMTKVADAVRSYVNK
jgi:chromosome partitioning protein